MNADYFLTLTDNAIFHYDPVTDYLCFEGNYEKVLFAEKGYEDFLANISGNPLIEEGSKDTVADIFRNHPFHGKTITDEIELLDSQEKYVHFKMNSIYGPDDGLIHGIITNTENLRNADVDPLTGLYNRYGITSFLTRTKKFSDCAVTIFDLDNFKLANDGFGHIIGDEVLKGIAQILRETLPEQAHIARYGGDEFLAYVSEVRDPEAVSHCAETVNRRVEEFGKPYGITASIGIALAKEASSYKQLFKEADLAVYYVKSHGKNSFKIYDPSVSTEAVLGKNTRVEVTATNSAGKDYMPLLLEFTEIHNSSLPIREKIERGSKLITEYFDVTRAYASNFVRDGSRVGKSYFYSRVPAKNIRNKLSLNVAKFAENYDENGMFFCTDVSKVNEPIRSFLLENGTQSLLQFQIYSEDGQIIGTFGANCNEYKKLWNKQEVEVMRVMSKIITKTIRDLFAECEAEADE